MFGIILISVGTLLHVYVFWRMASVPFVREHLSWKILVVLAVVLWIGIVSARFFGHDQTGVLAVVLELFGMTWLGALFLATVPLLAVDIVTVFGFFLPGKAPTLRGWALLAGALLFVTAVIQGLRPPVIQNHVIYVSGLPAEMDGKVLVALSDMHLGSLLGEEWLAERVAQVQGLQPDLVVLVGDIFEGHGESQDNLPPILRRFSAPLGVWAVLGNHEYYGGININLGLFKRSKIGLLRNSWVEVAPGLVLAGVDDLTTYYRAGWGGDPVSQTLAGRPPGATIFLSHTPWQAEKAAAAGVGLMLSGHTHGGQIWPFGYLIRRAYPLLAGQYQVDGMPVIVSRGTGTWGPRMRLWQAGEILRITLKKKQVLNEVEG